MWRRTGPPGRSHCGARAIPGGARRKGSRFLEAAMAHHWCRSMGHLTTSGDRGPGSRRLPVPHRPLHQTRRSAEASP
eukprot:11283514-Alexandrium_andersonii.AAC.1